VLDVQSRHIAEVIAETRRRGADVNVEPDVAAEQEWVDRCIRESRTNIEFLESCTPGYYNGEGGASLPTFQRNGPYSPGIVAFDEIVQEWRATGEYRGLEFSTDSVTVPGR
jgi:cyclohexanone monooxygenase